jgi:CDP-ribitol ribitolphosphotransferase
MKNLGHTLKDAAKQAAKDAVLGEQLPRAYRRAAQAPLEDGLVVFLEASRADMPESFSVLFDRVSRDSRYHAEFISLHKHHVDPRQYRDNCLAAVRRIAVAPYVFLCDASDVVSCLPLRPQTKVVQLWHACGAFKKWGMSTADASYGMSREQIMRHPGYENLSLVTVSAPSVVDIYAEAMGLTGRASIIKPLGVSRTDVFFDDAWLKAARQRLEQAVPRTQGRKVLLYAPTFRGEVSHATAPDRLDIPLLKRMLGDGWTLLVKQHPFVSDAPAVPADCADFAFDVTATLPIDVLLACADMLVTDYSSVVFEYALMGRPMAFFAYDLDSYRDDRDFYFDFEETAPGPVVADTAALARAVRDVTGEATPSDAAGVSMSPASLAKGDATSSSAAEGFDPARIAAFRERFMSACDGHATDRICEEVFGDAEVGKR